MNPNQGEPVNSGGVAVGDKPISAPYPAATPDISRIENLVAVAQQEAVAPQTEVPVQPQTEQFMNQFGSGVTPPPVGEAPSSSMPSADSSTSSATDMSVPQPSPDNLVPEQTQPAEALVQPEEDPRATFVQNIKDALRKLEEATKEKVTV